MYFYFRGWCFKRELNTDVRETRTVTGSRMFPFLAWFCSLSRTGKALVDDCGLRLQTRRRKKAPKRGKIQFPVAVRGPKSSVLKLPNIRRRHLLVSNREREL